MRWGLPTGRLSPSPRRIPSGRRCAFTGITTGGYLATPLNLVAGARVMSYVIEHSGAEVILCTDDQRPSD
jgi:hypothetical protein